MYKLLDSRRTLAKQTTEPENHFGFTYIWFLTNSVGRMQVVQALLADRLAAVLIFCWERRADQ